MSYIRSNPMPSPIPLALLVSQSNLGSRIMTRICLTIRFPASTGFRHSIGRSSFPYFGILIILSVYGIHRYETILRYRKYNKEPPHEPPHTFRTTAPRHHSTPAL